MNYIKLFQTHEEYETFVSGGTMVKPNVSHCISENDVHYNPIEVIETRLVVTLNVNSTTDPIDIMSPTAKTNNYFTEIEIDGVVQPSVVSAYTFTTTGEHTIKYTLAGTYIGFNAFAVTIPITNAIIPYGVTSIDYGAFYQCEDLIHVTIPSSVNDIQASAFCGCWNLAEKEEIEAEFPFSTQCGD